MVPKLSEIKNMLELQEMLNEFYIITEIFVELCDEKFSSLNMNSKLHLNELGINKKIISEIENDSTYNPIKLNDGSMVIVVPIIVCGYRVASIIAGRFTIEEQKLNVKDVPIISKRKLEALGKLLLKLAEIIGKMFYEKSAKIERERKIAESEEKYKSLVDILPDAVFIRTKDEIVFANNATARLLGAEKPEEIIGKKLSELVVMDTSYNTEKREKNISITIDGKRMPLTEQKMRSLLNNKEIYVETTELYYPLFNKDTWLVVSRDISDRKRLNETVIEKTKLLEDALEYDKLKTEFMANISHELRTPINVIMSALQMVNININKLGLNDENVRIGKYLVMMKQNSYRLIRLINNLIDITKIDGGYYKLNISNCDIVNIVEDITLSVAEYARNKGLDLIFDTDLEEVVLACDPDKIERIILNLLSNAIKFTSFGGSICVRIFEKARYLGIAVEDTGIGIPHDKQKMVFDRFVQVDRSLSRSCEGSGIGLSLVKSLVELHGGKIHLESEYGKGSTFIIMLPNVTTNEECSLETSEYNIGSNVEKVNVEFSDIYI